MRADLRADDCAVAGHVVDPPNAVCEQSPLRRRPRMRRESSEAVSVASGGTVTLTGLSVDTGRATSGGGRGNGGSTTATASVFGASARFVDLTGPAYTGNDSVAA